MRSLLDKMRDTGEINSRSPPLSKTDRRELANAQTFSWPVLKVHSYQLLS